MKIIEKPTYKSRTDFFFIFSGEDLSKGLDLVDLEQIYSKLYSEKMHQKFGKYILGVHKKATAVLSELGRHPLYFNIVKIYA